MKLLKTFTHPDFPTLGVEIDTREAARIVLVDDNNHVPLIYSRKHDIYKIPWGWVDPWEDILEAVIREAKEEAWCEIKVLWEIGIVVEERPATGYNKWINLRQTSYCYYGRIISKWDNELIENEISQWFELRWIPLEEVWNTMSTCNPTILKAQLVKERDIYIFEEWFKRIKKEA